MANQSAVESTERIRNNKRMSAVARPYVLVHGGWCGGWLWQSVATKLRAAGRSVTTPTLTGLGERRHSGKNTATLSTHIEDIVAHIEMEGLNDVVLVSQSYGGMVATGVLERIPDRIDTMIYLDAFVPADGWALIDCISPDRRGLFQDFATNQLPVSPLPLAYLGVTDPTLIDFATPRLVNHPWRTLFEPVRVSGWPEHVRVGYVRCTGHISEDHDRIAA
jgi:pimeloyl-ACP methyl ester carboxylesterase